MHKLIVTTAIAAAIGAGGTFAQAQTTAPAPPPATGTAPAPADGTAPAASGTTKPAATAPMTITPPEGFMPEEVVFTAENLEGATVYDAEGESIGEVHGLVFADGTTSMRKDMSPATDPAPTTPSTDAATAPASPAADADMTKNADASGTQAATTEGDRISGVGSDASTVTPTDATSPATPGMDATGAPTAGGEVKAASDASGTEAATAEGDRISGVGSDASTVTPTDATSPPGQGMGDAAPASTGTAPAASGTAVTDAVIDVGGFLGMGEHRVAVPVTELDAYRKDDDLRVYLPWTRDQLMELPEFEDKASG